MTNDKDNTSKKEDNSKILNEKIKKFFKDLKKNKSDNEVFIRLTNK